MKALGKGFLLILLVALLSGCFSVSTTINLNKNGSGTLEEKVLVKPIDMFGQAQQEPESIYDEADLRANAAGYGEGVKFISGKEISENGMNGYVAVYDFSDINKLKLNQNLAGKAINADMLGPEAQEDMNQYITFDFKSGGTSILKIKYPEEPEMEEIPEDTDMERDEDPEFTDQDKEMLEMMKEMYDGMKLAIKINFDGNIKETDATYQEGNSIVLMDIDFAKITENYDILSKLNGANQMSQAEFKSMMKDVEGMKVEVQDKLTVKFD
jgi:hypothetical protein